MTDKIVKQITDKLYGPSTPDLTPEMVKAAEAVARLAFDRTADVTTWTDQFATGDEAVDRPLYREYRRVILHSLVDLAQAKLQEMRDDGYDRT